MRTRQLSVGGKDKAQVAVRFGDRARVRQRPRLGFTLVELLVVITIIGLLMAMAVPALGAVIRNVQDTAVMVEISKLDAAMKTFESKMNRLPPDGTSKKDLAGFTKLAFGNLSNTAAKPPEDLNPARAIVFWLSQVSTDVTNPYGPPVAKGGPSGPKAVYDFFSFATDRVRNGMYYPKYADPKNDPPLVYFFAGTYKDATYSFGGQRIRPYHYGPVSGTASRGVTFAAAETFQIIAAGRDKDFGAGGRLYSESLAGEDWIAPADEDNIVNFDARLVGDIRR